MHKPALYSVIGLSVALACLPAGAQTGTDLSEQLKIMRQQLDEQRARVDDLERQLRTSGVKNSNNTVSPASAGQLGQLRGTGPLPAPQAATAMAHRWTRCAAPAARPSRAAGAGHRQQMRITRPSSRSSPARRSRSAARRNPARASAPGSGADLRNPGRADAARPPDLRTVDPVRLFVEQPRGPGRLHGDPGPADRPAGRARSEAQHHQRRRHLPLRRDNRFEIEGKIPYVYRSDATVSRELFTGTAAERAFDTSGKRHRRRRGRGALPAQRRRHRKPYFIAGLRFKSRTGRDPFEVVTDCQTRCLGENVTGTGLPLDLPTGSGFYSLQPSLTWLMPSDPAIFFGTFSYTAQLQARGCVRTVLNGERECWANIEPGDVFGFNFGMGLALNERASFSIGYDHNSVSRMKQNGQVIPGSVRMQLGTLLLGYSYRINNKRTLNVSVGAGLTRDTPDVTLMVRMPFSF
jgi:hypothetical protein